MGIYINPGHKSFQIAYNSEIFVDKTEMILYTNSVVDTNQRYISVSRPRRFGKSMAADMLCAYYGRGNAAELFNKCKVATHAAWDQYLGKFDVIRLVMTNFFKEGLSGAEALEKFQKLVTRELREVYPKVDYFDPDDLIQSMEDIYAQQSIQFVVVIDEWDAVFRECKEDKESQKKYLGFLRDWLKDKPYIALAYMTGILPIKKYGKHSALNMFDEYSMISPKQLAPYAGFTEAEVEDLCRKYNMRYEDISNWYDGYIVSDAIPIDKREEYREGAYSEHQISIYSPLSVVTAITTGTIENYWNKTETYEALAEYINRDFDGLKEVIAVLMDGGRAKVDIEDYQNDMVTFAGKDDILTLLIHLGYLGYDSESSEVFIPNREILDVFKSSTKSTDWVDTFQAFKVSGA